MGGGRGQRSTPTRDELLRFFFVYFFSLSSISKAGSHTHTHIKPSLGSRLPTHTQVSPGPNLTGRPKNTLRFFERKKKKEEACGRDDGGRRQAVSRAGHMLDPHHPHHHPVKTKTSSTHPPAPPSVSALPGNQSANQQSCQNLFIHLGKDIL